MNRIADMKNRNNFSLEIDEVVKSTVNEHLINLATDVLRTNITSNIVSSYVGDLTGMGITANGNALKANDNLSGAAAGVAAGANA